MSNPPDTMEWMHLYPGATWHGDASICGTRSALEQLREAIDIALRDGVGVSRALVNDGEGYFVLVHLMTADEMQRMSLPYTDSVAREPKRSKSIRPYQLDERPAVIAAIRAKIAEWRDEQ